MKAIKILLGALVVLMALGGIAMAATTGESTTEVGGTVEALATSFTGPSTGPADIFSSIYEPNVLSATQYATGSITGMSFKVLGPWSINVAANTFGKMQTDSGVELTDWFYIVSDTGSVGWVIPVNTEWRTFASGSSLWVTTPVKIDYSQAFMLADLYNPGTYKITLRFTLTSNW